MGHQLRGQRALGNPNTALLPPLRSPTSDSAFLRGEPPLPAASLAWALGQLSSCTSLLPKLPEVIAFREVTTRLGSEGSLQEAVSGALPRGLVLGWV